MTLLRTLTVLAAIAGSHCADAATFIVDTSSDAELGGCNDVVAADCSLRGAIIAANATPGADVIAFDLAIADPGYQAGTQHWRIEAASSLPNIMESLSIDGFTQAGAVPNTNAQYAGIAHTLKIELRGPGPAVRWPDGLCATECARAGSQPLELGDLPFQPRPEHRGRLLHRHRHQRPARRGQ